MYHIWLGVAAGIIAAGVAVMMGMFVVLGGDIVIHRANWELANILVPSIVSIFGWLVTIWWALRQVEISSERNRKLQHEMLTSNEKIKAIDSVTSVFIEINSSIHKIQSSIQNFKTNIEYKKKGKSNPDLTLIFQDSNTSYSELFINLETLKFNLTRLPAYHIKIDQSVKFITDIYDRFSGDSVWQNYQTESAIYIQNQSINDETLFEAILKVSVNCTKSCDEAISVVKQINNPNK